MTFTTKLLAGAAGLAALAAAAPTSAQYYGNSYGYQSNPYGSGYNGYNRYRAYGGIDTNAAAQQCTASVQQRLYNRRSIGGILGAFLGANTTGRVVAVTQVTPRNN